jgi:hypothetical protein
MHYNNIPNSAYAPLQAQNGKFLRLFKWWCSSCIFFLLLIFFTVYSIIILNSFFATLIFTLYQHFFKFSWIKNKWLTRIDKINVSNYFFIYLLRFSRARRQWQHKYEFFTLLQIFQNNFLSLEIFLLFLCLSH